MATARKSFLGLIEIADYEHLVDTHSSLLAEQLLNEFHKRLQDWIRPSDQARVLKNNRFIVILKGIGTRTELELATSKLERLFKPPHTVVGQPTPIDIHAGFALLDGKSTDTTKEVKQARIALREAKKTGSLYQVYNDDNYKRQNDESALVKLLESAVDQGELHLYYQPKIHAGFGTLVGAEALMRWHTEDGKVLTPRHFIDIAERHPVIRPMTWWAIKSAVARLAKWPTNIEVSVNVTPTLLLDDEIIAVTQDVLEIHGIEPSRLTLEVTENIMISNPEVVLTQLSRLRELGVRISIDDFGTGYCSLAYFRDLPADELKIDKCFVMPMLKSKKDLAIVKTVIELAHNFSLKVVAEGVEDKATAEYLGKLGCDHLQGFYYDQPLQIEDFEKRHLV